MMEGFKRYVPDRGGRGRCVTISACRLNIGPLLAQELPQSESYVLGYDGHRRFILEPAKGGLGGDVKLFPGSKAGSRFCASKPVIRFIRQQLKAPEKGTVKLNAKMVDGVLMFGIVEWNSKE